MANRSMGTLSAYLTANTSGFERGMKNALNTLKGFASTAGQLFSIDAIKNFGAASVAAYQEQAKNERVLANAFANSTSAVGLSLQDLKCYASEVQRVTNYGDEAVMKLESELLSFGNIAGKQFKQAIMLALDMSEQIGGDAAGNAKLLGKALSDPINGLTALRRAGVMLTDEQTAAIKRLVEAGDLEAAQNMLIAELQQKVGGAAMAAADPIKQLANAWGDVQEAIGKAILDAGLLDWVAELTEYMQGNAATFAAWGKIASNVLHNTGQVFAEYFDVLTRSIETIGQLLKAVFYDNLKLIGQLVTGDIGFGDFFKQIGGNVTEAVTSPWKDYETRLTKLRDINEGVDDAINKVVFGSKEEKEKKQATDQQKTVEEKVAELTRDSYNNATAATRGSLDAYRQRIEAGGQVKLLQQQLKVQQQQLQMQTVIAAKQTTDVQLKAVTL